MRARHRSPAQLAMAFVMVLLVAACSPAAAPSTATPPDPPASEGATPEPTPEATPDPTPEPEPSEAVGACMDPDTYELLLSDYHQWTAEDMSTLAEALEAYDFSGFEPAVRDFAEERVENFVARLRSGGPVDAAHFVIEVQVGEIPILPCE